MWRSTLMNLKFLELGFLFSLWKYGDSLDHLVLSSCRFQQRLEFLVFQQIDYLANILHNQAIMVVALNKPSRCPETDPGRCKARLNHGLSELFYFKRLSLLQLYFQPSLFEIAFCTVHALQAGYGFLSPIGSNRSDHAIHTHFKHGDLCHSRDSGGNNDCDKTYEHNGKSYNLAHDILLYLFCFCRQSTDHLDIRIFFS